MHLVIYKVEIVMYLKKLKQYQRIVLILVKVINLLNDSFDVEKLEYKFLDRKSNLILIEEKN